MELDSLENLDRQVGRLLESYNSTKQARDELAQRVGQLETEMAQLQEKNRSLEIALKNARQQARDPEKDELVRAKVDELLAKLEGF